MDYQFFQETTIDRITFDQFDSSIVRGSEVDTWYTKHFKDIKFDTNLVYHIRTWKPTYHMANGKSTVYDHQLKKIYGIKYNK